MAEQIKLDDRVLKELIKNISNEQLRALSIHDGVEYGVHQEFSERGHPSLVPAFEANTKNLAEVVGQAIENGVPLQDVLTKIALDIQREWAADVNVDTGAYKNSITVDEV